MRSPEHLGTHGGNTSTIRQRRSTLSLPSSISSRPSSASPNTSLNTVIPAAAILSSRWRRPARIASTARSRDPATCPSGFANTLNEGWFALKALLAPNLQIADVPEGGQPASNVGTDYRKLFQNASEMHKRAARALCKEAAVRP
jgi:hypothetical protein